MPQEIRADDWAAEVVQSPLPVLVDFYSTYCGPCRTLAPLIDRLTSEYEGFAKVLKLDTAERGEIAVALGITSVPTVVAFRDGEEVGRLVGLRPESEYRRLLSQAGVP
ncbi:thioredoxin family protein [Tautonia marina]|uniref:thioredoxin family protein n=1 Tax=Tautonia marina TaxID=2653855 RepID=UPI001261078E|nr:thioredoxin domain-containing protein [Tautonia marina]